MWGSGRRNIVYQWKARMANTDMGRLEVKAQLTQQCKSIWLVKYNCPTDRSWQRDKAVTLVLRRTWLKINKGERNNLQRHLKENYIRQNHGKEEIDLVAQIKYQQKMTKGGYTLFLKRQKDKMIDMTKQVPIKDEEKRRWWKKLCFILERQAILVLLKWVPIKIEIIKGYILPSKGKKDLSWDKQ